jgi:hypothetical protein
MSHNTFDSELAALLNKYSMENGSNTPDFILASYIQGCLDAFNKTVDWREEWYGRNTGRAGRAFPNRNPVPPTLQTDEPAEAGNERR